MKFLILISTIFVMSCGQTSEETSNYNLPKELNDCKIYRLSSENIGSTLNIVRCPLSSTSVSYSSGKHTVTTITTEDSIQTKTEELQKQLLEIQSKLNEIKSR